MPLFIKQFKDIAMADIPAGLARHKNALHAACTPIGFCGKALSDFPEFAQFLVSRRIESISFNPDALLSGIGNINAAENQRLEDAAPASIVVHS